MSVDAQYLLWRRLSWASGSRGLSPVPLCASIPTLQVLYTAYLAENSGLGLCPGLIHKLGS